MAINYRWKVPERVLLVTAGKHISLDMIREMDDTLKTYLEASNDALHIIFDNTALSIFPNDVRILAESVTFPTHSNMGWRVVYGESRVVRYLGQLSSKISGTSRLKYVDSLATACDFLMTIDSTLCAYTEQD